MALYCGTAGVDRHTTHKYACGVVDLKFKMQGESYHPVNAMSCVQKPLQTVGVLLRFVVYSATVWRHR